MSNKKQKKNIFSYEEIIKYSGLSNVPKYSKIKKEYNNIQKLLKKNTENVVFKEKLFYNQIVFLDYFDIEIDIKLEEKKNKKHETNLYYKNKLIKTFHKNYEQYFNYLTIKKMIFIFCITHRLRSYT